MRTSIFSTGISALAIMAAGGFGSASASAQEQAADDLVLEEIVVTARRYEESLLDAPLAIGVMTDDYMITQKVESIEEMMTLTPGASFVSFSKVQPEKSMRGVVAPTPGNSSSEQSIQTVVDGLVITKDFMKSPPLYDIERVEIMRGPQGTTFGRNASIGLIHLITKKPTREFETGVSTTVGSDELFEVDGYVSGPLSKTLSARFAFNFDKEDGPTESISTGKGLDGDSNFAFRGSLIFEPNNRFSAYIKIEYSEDDDEAPVRHGADCTTPFIISAADTDLRAQVGAPATHPPFPITFFDDCDVFKTEISSGFDFFLKREILTVSAELTFEIAEGINITSITGFMDGESDALADVLGSPVNIVFQATANDGNLFSEEIRIDNHGTGNRLRWLAGFYYLSDEEDRFEENRFFQDGAVPFPRVPSFLATISSNETDSIAVFGELAYDLTDQLELALGGRWTRDEKDYLFSVRASGFRPVIAGVTGCTPAVGIVCGSQADPVGFDFVAVSDNWSDFTGRVSLQYRLNDDHMFYALWSQGFKSGGFQPDARTPEAAAVPFNPERSNNYEIGWKGKINNRARIALTGFFLRNKGTQTVSLIPVGDGFTALISNVGAVETFGIEGEGTWLVSRNFRVGGTFALMDPELKNTILTVGIDIDGNEIFDDLSGQRPEVAPRWTVTFYGEYDVEFGDGSILTFRGDLIGRDDVFDDNSERATKARLRPTVVNVGARLTWVSADQRYRIMLWGKNLNEDQDIENIGPRQPNTLQLPFGFTGKRTFGITVGANF